ncbi:MAG: HPP family protein [Thiotrichales bacterium]|jgi:CBS-domain-containing membrane protein|nr:HPP family protein [Thiotrichales bacterium]
MKNFLKTLFDFLGVEQSISSHHEKFISAFGGFISIITIIAISQYFLGQNHYWLLVPSMGASAVLLFAIPHGPLSQPWPLIAGNTISATIGVTCGLLISDMPTAIASAVGLSILSMYYLKCIHPPGGATALSAVMATETIHSLGYQFVIAPVLLNALSIFMIAMLFNAFFHWRRYPAFLSQKKRLQPEQPNDFFDHHDFLNALKEIDSFVDINEYDLKRIFALAHANSEQRRLSKADIKLGRYYSNGKPGKDWSIRQIIDESPEKDLIIFKQITGSNKNSNECLTKEQFSLWAKYEIAEENGQWRRKSDTD